ncbi:TraR/DksA C4-type zinc finger protein [Shouchella shacheensis]|uniref:TraR/DksA C4-type zinc finger protein n=1 Tax=Shouchella shacheensis TaxID=1649580 RepID=UPI00073FB73A|nr:TraR/DksA C4-type zinc finger protein [Shouchella shacheensis]
MDTYADLKAELEKRQNTLHHRLKEFDDLGLAHGFASSVASGELSQYDNHPADSGSALYEREKDVALHEQIVLELEDVKHSLDKFEKGTYGICEATGGEIPRERLEANPTARTNVQYAKMNNHYSRPAEEDVLRNFDQFNFDSRDDETEFDAEDAYQSVARFNELPMVYEDSSLDDNEELVGYVEEIEGFLSTGIEGYSGDENVQYQKNVHYDQYLNEK